MSSGIGANAPWQPIHYADIIHVRGVLDPNGQNPKNRRVVVMTPDHLLAAGGIIIAVAVTSRLPFQITADHILLPYKNPPGGHPRTGLTKKAAALCTWLVVVDANRISYPHSGFVPPIYMSQINKRAEEAAKTLGGWP